MYLLTNTILQVMRIGEYQYTAFIIANLCKIIKVHIIISVLTETKRIEDYLTMISLWRQTEWMIDWRLYNNLFVKFRKYIHHKADTPNNTRNKNLNHSGFTSQSMMSTYPVDDSRAEVFWFDCIAKDRMRKTILESLHHKVRASKIHISYPQGAVGHYVPNVKEVPHASSHHFPNDRLSRQNYKSSSCFQSLLNIIE